MILVDAGPLIAVIHKDDAHHARCVDTLQSITEPLGTVWPALTEAMYLLSFSWKAQDALWEMVERGVVEVLTLDRRDMSQARDRMKKYKDLPMDLADAALVAVAEREKIRRIFTLDRRDFEIYRPTKLGRFIILPE
ncbi:MAG: PIN domain-containing protein [Nitrospira sp.]|nr:PIN domain-containing protein [Nitrospira sp.]MDR4466510.1 PIN domain-containing protein [Nitrospira sp.]